MTLPTAVAADELLRSTGAGTTYAAEDGVDLVERLIAEMLSGEPAGGVLVADGAGGLDPTSALVSDLLAAANAVGARTALSVPSIAEALLEATLTTRGDLLRRGASGSQRFAAAGANTFVGGDGTDVGVRTAEQVKTSLGLGAVTATGADADEALASIGAIGASVLTTNGDLITRAAGVPARITVIDLYDVMMGEAYIGEPEGTTTIADGVGGAQYTSGDVSAFLASANVVAARAALSVYSAAEVDALIAAVGGSMSAGHSWERTDPATAGGGARFLDVDSLQIYTSSGHASPGWGVELPGGLGPDRASLTTTSGILTTGVDLSGYAINSLTIAALIYWDGPIVGTYAAVTTFGNNAAGTRGCLVYFKQNGGNVDLIAQGGVGAAETVLQASANPTAGLHAVCISAVNVAGTHKWRWSLDGSAAADTNMTANYVTPTSTDSFAVGSSGSALLPIPGKVCDVAVWQSTLSNADIAALTTLPGTPTYRLPESASTGAAQIRAEANRYDATFPLVLPVRGLAQPMTVGASVRKVAYP